VGKNYYIAVLYIYRVEANIFGSVFTTSALNWPTESAILILLRKFDSMFHLQMMLMKVNKNGLIF
jgi:hypothetical protein